MAVLRHDKNKILVVYLAMNCGLFYLFFSCDVAFNMCIPDSGDDLGGDATGEREPTTAAATTARPVTDRTHVTPAAGTAARGRHHTGAADDAVADTQCLAAARRHHGNEPAANGGEPTAETSVVDGE